MPSETPGAGRELSLDEARAINAEVVHAVFGWRRTTDENGPVWVRPDGAKCSDIHVPDFSRDIAAAWTVVEHMKADGWSVNVYESSIGATVKFEKNGFPTAYATTEAYRRGIGYDQMTPAFAICMAALDAAD